MCLIPFLLLVFSCISFADQLGSTSSSGTQSFMSGLPFLIAIMVVSYFIMIRPQLKKTKEHRKTMESIHEGDEIVLHCGILGRIERIIDNYLVICISNNGNIIVQKQAVSSVLPKDTIIAIERK